MVIPFATYIARKVKSYISLLSHNVFKGELVRVVGKTKSIFFSHFLVGKGGMILLGMDQFF